MEKSVKNPANMNKSTGVALTLTALLTIILVFIVQNPHQPILYIALGVVLLGAFIFLLIAIPKHQCIEIKKFGIQFRSLAPRGQCRTIFWKEIKDIIVKNDPNGNEIVIQIYKYGSTGIHPEEYIDRSIHAEVYGYETNELYEILEKQLHAFRNQS